MSVPLAKRKREEDQERIEKTKNNINKYFSNKPAAAAAAAKTKVRSRLYLTNSWANYVFSQLPQPKTMLSSTVSLVKSTSTYLHVCL